MGLIYYRIRPSLLKSLQASIEAHEGDMLGPRARGYWFDYPDEYDYTSVQATARTLDEAGQREAIERLELSEVQAHALSQIEVDMPRDNYPFPPAMFLTSADPETVELHLRLARRHLGAQGERIGGRLGSSRDVRVAGYLNKIIRHLREAVPLVMKFYERAAEAGDAILIVDLRARDVFIPDAVELLGVTEGW